jgi:hypothetical protein
MRMIIGFLEHFRGQRSANLVRASRWWAQRDKFCNEGEHEIKSSPISCYRGRSGGLKQLRTIAASGRGHSVWNGYNGYTLYCLMHLSVLRNPELSFQHAFSSS